MGTPWVGYVRVSHVGERGGDSFRSPEDQAASIEGWAKARRERVVVLEPELDASGGDRDRPVLAEAIAGIEAGAYRGLVVAYLSRASRSVSHLLEIWDRIEAAGGQVVAVDENIDTSTPAGRLTRTMLAAIAEHELDLHRERFADLRASATERGIWQRRQVPRGYVRNPETRRLEPGAPEEVEAVRQAFRDRAAGRPLTHIARDLGMTTSGVRHVFRNRVYLGELHVGQNVNRDAHEAIVPEDEWLAVQAKATRRPPRRFPQAALLAGLIRCGSCGRVMTRGRVNRKYTAYRCPAATVAAECPGRVTIMCGRVEDYVEALALPHLEGLVGKGAERGVAVEEARARVTAAEGELAAYVAAVSAEDLGAEAFAAGARSRRDAVEDARAALEGAAGAAAVDIDGDLVNRWGELGVEHRNAVLRGLLEVVAVYPSPSRRASVGERVQVVLAGAEVLYRHQAGPEVARGIHPVPVLGGDSPFLLGVELV